MVVSIVLRSVLLVGFSWIFHLLNLKISQNRTASDIVGHQTTFRDIHWHFGHLRLTLAGKIFFATLRGKWPQKWSPGQSALLSDTVFGDIQIWLQKKEKTLLFLMDMSKCPQMSTISEKCPQRKIYQFSNFFLKLTKFKISNSLHFDIKCHQMSSNVFLSYLK